MKTPTPLPGELDRLVARAKVVQRLTPRERAELWNDLQLRSERRAGRPWLGLTLGLAVLAAVVLVLSVGRGRGHHEASVAPAGEVRSTTAAASAEGVVQTRTVHLGTRCDLFLSPDAEVTLPPRLDANRRGAYQVRLLRGRIAAVVGRRGADEPLAVVTDQLRVSVVGTRFSVALEEDVTSVAVEEGKVKVESAAGMVMLTAGQSIRSDDPLLAGAQATAPEPCAAGSLDARRACFAQAAAGAGLLAENALYALGLLERDQAHDPGAALARFREYERRFPRGVLAPEVALARAATLLRAGRGDEACAVADAFLRRFPRDQATYGRLSVICGR
jgi:ferric-dicitrate binding protein FerR (iron transport regulator)